MKSLKKLLILLIILALCLGVFMAVKLLRKDPAPIELSDILLYQDNDHIAAISWDYQGESLTLLSSDDGWLLEGEPDFPVNQGYPAMMSSELKSAVPLQTLTKFEKDPAVYGLGDPVLKIRVTNEAGETTGYTVGSFSEQYGGYFLKSDRAEDKLFVADDAFVSAFRCGRRDIVRMEALPVMNRITALSVEDVYHTLTLRSEEESGSEGKILWFASDNGGEEIEASLEKISEYASGVINPKRTGCAAYHADDDLLEKLGLSDGATRIDIAFLNDQGETQHCRMLIGIEKGNERYMRLEDSRMVYLMDASGVNGLLTVTSAFLSLE